MQQYKENFTAILPVTCNANCGFCPEKEMEEKAGKEEWIESLVDNLRKTRTMGYDHVSLSGGEPTLDPRLLGDTIQAIIKRTHINRIGITTNGQFLESSSKLSNFFNATVHGGAFIPYFINISRHAFDSAENNEIMGVQYKHTLADILYFRKLLPLSVSFRLNMVLTDKSDVGRLFREAYALQDILRENFVQIAFRTDYSLIVDKEDGLVPQRLRDAFADVFGELETTYSCPTCVTYQSKTIPGIFLKGANFEPTDKEELQREFIQHQDGKLYHDWQRNKPVTTEELLGTDPSVLLGQRTLSDVDLMMNGGILSRRIMQVSATDIVTRAGAVVNSYPPHGSCSGYNVHGGCGSVTTKTTGCGGGSCGGGSGGCGG